MKEAMGNITHRHLDIEGAAEALRQAMVAIADRTVRRSDAENDALVDREAKALTALAGMTPATLADLHALAATLRDLLMTEWADEDLPFYKQSVEVASRLADGLQRLAETRQ